MICLVAIKPHILTAADAGQKKSAKPDYRTNVFLNLIALCCAVALIMANEIHPFIFLLAFGGCLRFSVTASFCG
jgi:hypothetical protein